jgi:cystathionine beta-lyase/cystathionine gamma-synthase|tara:strand:+ start:3255 stop:4415 length:1161 start_codon:yes stop_codon:yes gene_type:complete
MKNKFETIAIHVGNSPDPVTGSISPSIHLTSTFVQDGIGKNKGYDYSRGGNPTRARLEKNIAALEGGFDAIAFASGMAATTALFQGLQKGDHVIVSRNVYGGTYRMATQVLKHHGLDFDFVDTRDSKNIENNINPNTKWVFIETPTNPMLEITEIQEVSKICKEHGIKLAVDNTFMSSFGQRPLEFGADCVMHSSTKFIGGHSDVLGGILVAKDEDLAKRLHFIQKSGGAIPSPFDSWLLLRSVKTMSMRVQKASDNAMVLAKYFDSHDSIAKTIYPGLSSHAQHEVAKKQQLTPGGDVLFGSMISIVFNSKDTLDSFLSQIKLFSLAESLGGVESLMSVPYYMTHADVPKEVKAEMDLVPELLRLAVGVEHIDDLLSDIESALTK